MISNHKLNSLWTFLENCSDIQMELEDTCDSFDILIEDIQMISDELRGDLERIQDHMLYCKALLRKSTANIRPDKEEDCPQELPFD